MLPLGFAIGLFAFWETICRLLHIPVFVLPAPSDVVPVLFLQFNAILFNAYQTAFTTLVGFAIGTTAGLFFGGIIGSSASFYRVVYPTLIGLNSIPKIALIPVFVIWFGFGSIIAVLTSAIMAFFPVTVIVATSIVISEPELIDVLRVLGARKRDVFLKVSIPRAMPQFFGSIKVAITAAFIGTIAAETMAANKGLGYVMVVGSSNLNVPLVFAGFVILSLMGVCLYLIAVFFERRLTSWAYRGQG